ncbi:MAG: hypothetical protein HQM06_07135 [Magnetococcales bacterium]|nr:hypothetical protein [Magnetococcales bacterium]
MDGDTPLATVDLINGCQYTIAPWPSQQLLTGKVNKSQLIGHLFATFFAACAQT